MYALESVAVLQTSLLLIKSRNKTDSHFLIFVSKGNVFDV